MLRGPDQHRNHPGGVEMLCNDVSGHYKENPSWILSFFFEKCTFANDGRFLDLVVRINHSHYQILPLPLASWQILTTESRTSWHFRKNRFLEVMVTWTIWNFIFHHRKYSIVFWHCCLWFFFWKILNFLVPFRSFFGGKVVPFWSLFVHFFDPFLDPFLTLFGT